MRFSVYNSHRTIVGLLTFALGTLLWCQSANAVPSNNRPFSAKQPDGRRIALQLHGDERRHWLSDQAGYSVVREKEKRFVYARKQGKKLLPTQFEVGKANPRAVGLKRRQVPQELNGIGSSGSTIGGNFSSITAVTLNPAPLPGTLRQLVIPIRFSNHLERPLPAQTEFDALFNSNGSQALIAPTGSVKDFYFENSYGLLNIESTVRGWFDVTQTEQYCADGRSGNRSKLSEAFVEALVALDNDPAFSFQDYDQNQDGFVDSIIFVHSGYGSEFGGSDINGTFYTDRIWSHHSEIFNWTSSDHKTVKDYAIVPALWWTEQTNITRLGVIVHEMGHLYGIPDLYDTDNPGQGVGSYGVMGNAWGFDYSQYYPPHFSPWSKIRLGWITPTQVVAPGRYEAEQSESSPTVFRIDHGYPDGEYLLLENRQPIGFDVAMPQGGLAVWHIDDKAGFDTEGYPGQSGWPENGNHYRTALLQADGSYDLERGRNRGDSGDLYHAAGVSTVAPDTSPNTDAYQFGMITSTGNTIHGIAEIGLTMGFSISFDGTVVTPPPDPDFALADAETRSGRITGTHQNTHQQDGIYQTLVETDSADRRPKKRFDSLEHLWLFNLSEGNRLFNIDARVTDGGDADSGIDLQWSSSTDGPWNHMLTMTKSVDDNSYQTFNLGDRSGVMYLRAVDTDRTAGQRKHDVIEVDHMFLSADPTANQPPAAAANPSPADSAIGVGTNPQLTWTAGNGATAHEVYFGVSPALGSGDYQGLDTAMGFSPGSLLPGTKYYWRIDEVNSFGTAQGLVWSFTTGSGGAASLHIDSMIVDTENAGKGNKRGRATVVIVDDQGAPVADAFVTGSFSGDFNENITAQTNGLGNASSTTNSTIKGGVSFTYCVFEVTSSAIPWDGNPACGTF